jgi:hypothetical protein
MSDEDKKDINPEFEDEASQALAEAFAASADAPAAGDGGHAGDEPGPEFAPGPQDGDNAGPAPGEPTDKGTIDTEEKHAAEDDGSLESLLREKEMPAEKKAQAYDSMLGRLKKEREEKEALRKELEDAKKAKAPGGDAPGPEPRAPQAPAQAAKIEDENLAQLVDDFAAKHPDMAALVREDSQDGRRLRKRLEEYGEDLTLDAAESVTLRRQMAARGEEDKAAREQWAKEQDQAAAKAHKAEIYKAHPDVAKIKADDTLNAAFEAELGSWIESLPFKDGQKWADIRQHGNASQVIEMLNEFKEHLKAKQRSAESEAEAAEGIPSRGASSPKPKPGKADPNDFDGAMAEALALRGNK